MFPVTKNILTIDVEDWYQSSLEILGNGQIGECQPVMPTERVVTNTRRLLAVLCEYKVSATFFILGTVAETFPGLVREICDAGHEVASHGYGHDLVYKLTPAAFAADVERSRLLLEDITGKPVRGYRAPYFSITRRSQWALEVLMELGLNYDSSIFPIRRRLYGFPGREAFPHPVQIKNGTLLELPISTFGILGQNVPVGGGGYFRLLPYGFIRWAIRRINAIGKPAIFYLHPYELDAEELKHPLPGQTVKMRWVRWTQGLNRGKTEAKLRSLLTEFEFTAVQDAYYSQ